MCNWSDYNEKIARGDGIISLCCINNWNKDFEVMNYKREKSFQFPDLFMKMLCYFRAEFLESGQNSTD